MPLTVPAPIRGIYAECNTPPVGDVAGKLADWDAFYSLDTQGALTGGDLTAALAAAGLTYASGTFTATARVVLAVDAYLVVVAAPGGACTVAFLQPGFDAYPAVAIANPNTLSDAWLRKTFVANVGDTFALRQTCANGTDTPFSYATLSIVRLV